MATRIERTETIESLTIKFRAACGIYLTDFTGINVEKITKFRKDLRANGARYVVVKNTLARKALERCGKEALAPFLKGPVGVAIAEREGTVPAKVIKEFQKENKNLFPLKAAFVDGTLFSADDALRLATLPSREVLLSQLLSCLQAPMANLVGALCGITTKLVGTLESVKQKKEANG
jgi:large subunit ribosomal protein L10